MEVAEKKEEGEAEEEAVAEEVAGEGDDYFHLAMKLRFNSLMHYCFVDKHLLIFMT